MNEQSFQNRTATARREYRPLNPEESSSFLSGARRYVVTPSGARIVADADTPASAILALRRHAEVAEVHERDERTRGRRKAA